MAGVLQAPPTTALFDRMKRRKAVSSKTAEAITNFSAPNFRTTLPLPVLLGGLSRLLSGLYEPESRSSTAPSARSRSGIPAHAEAARSAADVQPPPGNGQFHVDAGRAVELPGAYWEFLWKLIRNYATNDTKMWMGIMVLLSAHHF
jgi:hypothetical protein